MDRENSLPRQQRLSSHGSIRRLFDAGKGGFVYPLRYIYLLEQTEDEHAVEDAAQVLFTVPKRFHKRANRRNLLRRRVKEAYRLQRPTLLNAINIGHTIDIAIIYSTKEEKNYKVINNAVRKILENIAKDI